MTHKIVRYQGTWKVKLINVSTMENDYLKGDQIFFMLDLWGGKKEKSPMEYCMMK